MNDTPEEAVWQRLSKTLFGIRKTSDEGIFTYRVMQQVRAIQPVSQQIAWHQFLRWAVPALGIGIISLALAIQTPPSMVWPDENPLMTATEDFE